MATATHTQQPLHPFHPQPFQECRNQSLFPALASILSRSYGLQDSRAHRLDVGLWPHAEPRNGTFDRLLRDQWYGRDGAQGLGLGPASKVQLMETHAIGAEVCSRQPSPPDPYPCRYASKHVYDAAFLELLPRVNTSARAPEPNPPRRHRSRRLAAAPPLPAADSSAPRPALRALKGQAFAYTVLHNETAKHAIPVTLNAVHNAILDLLLGRRDAPPLLHASTHPFPASPAEGKVRVGGWAGESAAASRDAPRLFVRGSASPPACRSLRWLSQCDSTLALRPAR